MLAKDLISDVIPHLMTSDTGIKALIWMEIFRVSHLPIVNNDEFLGLVSDTDIYDLNEADQPIGSHPLSLIRPFVYRNQHVYEVISLVSKLNLSLVPVLNEQNHYVGCITTQKLVAHFGKIAATNEPGAIIILELNINDYVLTEIAQIVESNDAKILSLYVSSFKNSTQLNVTLKLNTSNLSSIVQTFERYNYNIKASFMEDEALEHFYDERFESFMNYLDI
ncbi:MAG: CBS domain-containing protein [Bacteroidales bacterium]|nr:CBS domain-containing protein [Bacteroidales bacterium]